MGWWNRFKLKRLGSLSDMSIKDYLLLDNYELHEDSLEKSVYVKNLFIITVFKKDDRRITFFINDDMKFDVRFYLDIITFNFLLKNTIIIHEKNIVNEKIE